jgi:glycosyltransferase involved in cell wall biosynthesis
LRSFNIVLFFRKARNAGNYSIETYFNDLIKFFPSNINAVIKTCKYESAGFWRRIYITFEALFRQGNINHVTGDVHFLTLFLQKKRTILTIHDCWFMRHPSPFARFIFKWFWLKLPVQRSAIVTAVSQSTKNDIITYTGCSPQKIRVINTSVSDNYQPSPKEFNKKKPLLLQIGTVGNKNLERLIPALEGINCTLNIIGNLSESQLALLKQHTVDHVNSFNISDEEMLMAYKNCDIVTFVSLLEGFGMPIIEANRIERVVVTSNVSSMPEIAADAACLVDPHDIGSIREGILKVINDDNYREQLIANGRKNKNRFVADKIAEQYYYLYMELLNLNQD